MPTNSKPKKSAAKELEELRNKLVQKDRLIAEQEILIATLQEAEKARELEKENRIPVPEGQAGRGSGYKLFYEMRVSKATFHSIRTVVRHKTSQYLDITKSLRQQDKSRIRKARVQISNNLPFVRKYYHASWPIHPIMKQYLSSSSKAYKKAKAHLKDITEVPALLKERPADTRSGNDRVVLAGAAKKPENSRKRKANEVSSGNEDQSSEESDLGLSDADDWKREFELMEEEAEEEEKASISKKYAEQIHSLIQHKGTRRMVDLKTPKNVLTGQKVSNTRVCDTTATTMTEKEHNGAIGYAQKPNGPLQNVSNKQKPLQRFAAVITQSHQVQAAEKSGTMTDKANDKANDFIGCTPVQHVAFKPSDIQIDQSDQHATAPTVGKGKYPMNCPNTDFCEDPFPTDPSEKIKNLYEQYKEFRRCNSNFPRHKNTGEPKGLPFALTQLCLAIAADKTLRNMNKERSRNWPTGIDFTKLHQRVLDLNRNGEIWSLLANSIVLHETVAWKSFLGKISGATSSKNVNGQTVRCGLTFHKWSNMVGMMKFDVISGSAGYYSPAGAQIIHTTLQYHIYSPYAEAFGALLETMADILGAHGDTGFPTADFWKGTLPTTLPLLDFIFYVACPHIVNMLISQDLSVMEAEANQVRLESVQHGLHFHDTNEEIEEQVMRITIPRRLPSPINNVERAEHGNNTTLLQNTCLAAPTCFEPAENTMSDQPDRHGRVPIRFARKQRRISPSSSPTQQNRSHDNDKENEDGDEPAPPTKKRRKGPAPRPIGPAVEKLHRSGRHKNKDGLNNLPQ